MLEGAKLAVVVQCVGLSIGLIAVLLALAAGWTFIPTVCTAILAGNAGVFFVVAVLLVRAWRRGRPREHRSRMRKRYG